MPELSANDKVMDRLVGHQVEVLRLAKGISRDVEKILAEADRKTYDVIMTRSSRNVNSLLSSVKRINDQAYRTIARDMASTLIELASYEADVLPSMFERELPLLVSARSVPRSQTRAIIHEEPMVGGLLGEWISGLAQGRFARIRSEIRRGISQREEPEDIVKRIRGTRRLNYRDGVARVSVNSARGLATTATNSVVNSARKSVYQANKPIISHVMWSAVLDDDTCPQCAGLDGELFRLDEMPEVPLHINCRCLLIPVFGPEDDEWDDIFEFRFDRPKKLRYSDWLKNQTDTTQDQILGAERAAFFRRGLPLKKFVDGSGINYNLAELRQVEARTMATKQSRRKGDVKVLKNFGYKPDLPDQRDKLFSVAQPESVALPVRVSLREDMPPVFDQGNLGSCTANAAVAAHMYLHRASEMLSRLDLYWSTRYIEGFVDEDSGASIRNTIKAMVKFGVCTEATWPYKIRKFRTDPPPAADKEAREYRITSYQRLLSNADFMKCLAQGRPFQFGFSVYDNVFDPLCAKKGILLRPSLEMPVLGGHAVLCVGYDQNFHSNQVFKNSGLSTDQCPNFMYEIRNSWGPEFGDGGYFYMDATMLDDRNLTDDFWVVRA